MNKQEIYTKKDIFAQLAAMGAPRDGIVLMHSALRLVGPVEGDAAGLLDALLDYFTANGGLFCVPTHTWANLSHPECDTLELADPHTCLGAFSDLAVADGRGLRSENPTHSMVVFGDRNRAAEFVKNEPYITAGTAPDSCYGKLYEQGGFVLLVGVAHNKNTYLHCVEEMLNTPDRLTEKPRPVTVRYPDGRVIRREIYSHKTSLTNDISQRFPKYETAFRYHGAITDGFLGNAPTQLCDARIMKQVMELIYARAEGADPLANEKAIPPKWYC